MAEQVSDSELLDLNDNNIEDFMSNKSTQHPAKTEWTDTQSNSHEEEMTQTTQLIPESQDERTRKMRSKSRNTRQTLKQFDRKLDKIHQGLAQVSRSQQTREMP